MVLSIFHCKAFRKSKSPCLWATWAEIEAHPSAQLIVTWTNSCVVQHEDTEAWNQPLGKCPGSKSTWIWLPSCSCCAKPVARSWYHNETWVRPVHSRTPLGTSPVSTNWKGKTWSVCGKVICLYGAAAKTNEWASKCICVYFKQLHPQGGDHVCCSV